MKEVTLDSGRPIMNRLFNGRDNNQIHFMNSCRLKKSTFTCAVDSFLEISFVILGSFLKGAQLKSSFFELLHECFEQYNALLNSDYNYDNDKDKKIIEEFLSQIRQPVWDFLALNCPSFANRDCESIFSEIFSNCIFNKLRIEERNLFLTCYMLKGHCDNCGEDLFSRQVNVMVNYFSQDDLNSLNNINDWQTLLDPRLKEKL